MKWYLFWVFVFTADGEQITQQNESRQRFDSHEECVSAMMKKEQDLLPEVGRVVWVSKYGSFSLQEMPGFELGYIDGFRIGCEERSNPNKPQPLKTNNQPYR